MPSGCSNSFNSMQFFGKIWQNRMLPPPPIELAPLPWGNPGSATDISHINNHSQNIFLVSKKNSLYYSKIPCVLPVWKK